MRETYGRAGRAAAEALKIPAPQGGTFLFFDLRPYLRRGETATELLERCVDAGVMLTPGNACGAAYADWARLCFTSVPEPELHEALKRLRSVFF
jgi:N-succinyldiaminopimelate aminotransferase